MKNLFVAGLLSAMAFPALAQAPSIMGVWLVASGKAHIQIAPCADPGRGPICGTIVALINPKGADGKPVEPEIARDFRNPDAGLRDRKVLGQLMGYDFKKASEPNVLRGRDDLQCRDRQELQGQHQPAGRRHVAPARLYRHTDVRRDADLDACALMVATVLRFLHGQSRET